MGVYERIGFPNSVFSRHSLPREFIALFGWDQVLAFNRPFLFLSYRTVELGMLFIFAILLVQGLSVKKGFAFKVRTQLYVLACFAGMVLPARAFYFPAGFIAECFSLIAAYQDERALAGIEITGTQLVDQLPPMRRVAALLHYRSIEDGFTENILDRVCVGRCYSYGNYEAPSFQFRIRAETSNSVILADLKDSVNLARGTYRVQSRDLPLSQIYACGPNITDLCMRELKEGELNGSSKEAIVRQHLSLNQRDASADQ